jgi:multidrug efflux pump subunit AcrA (membrane-fusion protein)
MAEIPIERKPQRSWWPLALLALLVLLGVWYFTNSRTVDAPATAAGGEVGTPSVTATAPAAGSSEGVTQFLAFVDQQNAQRNASVSHDYAVTGVRRLAAAIGDLAAGDSLAGSTVTQQVAALNTVADSLAASPAEALTHADYVRAAFLSSAELLQGMQQRRFPALADQAAAVRASAESLDKGRPLLEQTTQVQQFFERAAAVVRGMSGGSA